MNSHVEEGNILTQQQNSSVPTCRGWFIKLRTTDPPMAFDPPACVGSNLGLFGVPAIAIVIPVADYC
jgi:hypothetical protein